ncbi:MAG: MBG domain-containing protein, partial [Bacteroidota bacterium]
MVRSLLLLCLLWVGLGYNLKLYAQVPPTFTSTPIETGVFGDAYSYPIETDDADDDAIDLLIAGTLPANLTFTDNGDGTALISGTLLQTGSFPITITAQETTGALQSADLVFTITVSKRTLTVTADDASRPYGSANPIFSLSYGGFVNGDNSADLDTPPTASTTASIASDAGTYIITASGGSDNNYDFTYQPGTLTITQAALTATAEDKNRLYGAMNPALTIIYTGFLNGDDASAITPPSISTTAVPGSDAGSYPINLSGGSAINYILNLVNGTLVVGQATLTATADDVLRTYGSPNPVLSISYIGFVNGDDASSLDAAPIASTSATITSDVGTYPITLSGGTDTNYNLIN